MASKSNEGTAGTPRKFIPLDCSLVLVLALTYYAVYLALFIAGIFYSGNIVRIFNNYGPEVFPGREFYLFLSAGTLLYALAVGGLLMMVFKIRGGFYLFSASIIVILIIDLAFFEFDWIRYLVNTGLLFLLGILHFSGRCYHKKLPEGQEPPE